MQTSVPLEPGGYYHVYNRGVNRASVFIEERNYAYFLQLYQKYIAPVADTFAYCLLQNHFHFLLRIRANRRGLHGDQADRRGLETLDRFAVSRAFGNWLNAYAKAFNKANGRTGSLFQRRFSRLPVTSDRYFVAPVHYIHCNPQKHGFVRDFREWPYSSYRAFLSDAPTRIERATVLEWFGGPQGFQQFHAGLVDESSVRAFVGEDDQ